jgi:nitrous oxidase accessory protein NosD
VASLAAALGTAGAAAYLLWSVLSPVQAQVVPSAPMRQANLCDSLSAQPRERPTAQNTGVPPGVRLRPKENLVIDKPGTVIDGRDMTGGIEIKADNVTIRNSRLRVTAWYGITYADGVTGTKILNNDIFTTEGGYVGIATRDSIVCGNHIRGFENGITMGGNTMVRSNLIEDFRGMPGEDPHFDGIEVYFGSNSRIWGNDIRLVDPAGRWLRDTGAINITTHWSDIRNVDIRGNWIGGGSYTLYVTDVADHVYEQISIVGNRWYGKGPAGHAAWGAMSVDDAAGVSEFRDNLWGDTGEPLKAP